MRNFKHRNLLTFLVVLLAIVFHETDCGTLEMRRAPPTDVAWLDRMNSLRARSARTHDELIALHASSNLVVHSLKPTVAPFNGGAILTLTGEHFSHPGSAMEDTYRCSFSVRMLTASGVIDANYTATRDLSTDAVFHPRTGDITCSSPDLQHRVLSKRCPACRLEAAVHLIISSRNSSRLSRFTTAPARLAFFRPADAIPVVSNVHPRRASSAGGTLIEIRGHFRHGVPYMCIFGSHVVPAELVGMGKPRLAQSGSLSFPTINNDTLTDRTKAHHNDIPFGTSAPVSLLERRVQEALSVNVLAQASRADAGIALLELRSAALDQIRARRSSGHGYSLPRHLGGGAGSRDIAASEMSWDAALHCVAPKVEFPHVTSVRVSRSPPGFDSKQHTTPAPSLERNVSSKGFAFHYIPEIHSTSIFPLDGFVNGGALIRLGIEDRTWTGLAQSFAKADSDSGDIPNWPLNISGSLALGSLGTAYCRFAQRVLVTAIIDPVSHSVACITPPARHVLAELGFSEDALFQEGGELSSGSASEHRFTSDEADLGSGSTFASLVGAVVAQLARVRSDLVDALASEEEDSADMTVPQAAIHELNERLVAAGAAELTLDIILGPQALNELGVAGLVALDRELREQWGLAPHVPTEASLLQMLEGGGVERAGGSLLPSGAPLSTAPGDFESVLPPHAVLRRPALVAGSATRRPSSSTSPTPVATPASLRKRPWLVDSNVSDAGDLVASHAHPGAEGSGHAIAPPPRLDPEYANLASDVMAIASAALVHIPEEAARAPTQGGSAASGVRASVLHGTRLSLVDAYIAGYALGRLDHRGPYSAAAETPEELLARICRALNAAHEASCPLAKIKSVDETSGLKQQVTAANYVCGSVRTLLKERLPVCFANIPRIPKNPAQ